MGKEFRRKTVRQENSAFHKYINHGRQFHASVESSNNMNTFDLSSLSIGPKFAQGAHSNLYHGTCNDQHVAVKIIKVEDQEADKKRCLARLEKEFNREVDFLSKLDHPNVLRFIGAFKQEKVFCIITEFLSEGCLRSYLIKLRREDSPLTLQKVLVFAHEIARGMEYVHSQGIIHRDLKPGNVLIDHDHRFSLKIADFGVSCKESCSEIPDPSVGTCRWMAPEMIRRKKPCSRKVDVYSFGFMLFEMVSGKLPFAEMNPLQVAYAVVNKNLRPEFPKECPTPMKALIEQCWCSDPKKRPEFYQIIKVVEQFEAELARDGTLNLVQNCVIQNNHKKKRFLHWIRKLLQ